MSIFDEPNISCRGCGHRHPQSLTCAEAKQAAERARLPRVPGTRYVAELPPGQWVLCNFPQGSVVAVCSDHAPRVIYPDGTVEELKAL